MASTRKRAPADLRGRLLEFLRVHVCADAGLCLGYSGGLDSSVLLHLLADLRGELPFRLSALHVHHGLSPRADDWAAFCRRACASLDVPLTIRRVRVVADGAGVEAAARTARYRAFAEQQADFVVLAHQRDDQAETFLLRLLRGGGAHGLAAMATARPLQGTVVHLLRPLLDQPRPVLEGYARSHAVAHVEDDSNLDTGLDRNWLRHEVLPLLAGRYPACRPVIARSAALLAESAGLLDDLARLDLARVADPQGLDLARLAGLDAPRARNLLRYWLRVETGVAPSLARLQDMLGQLCQARADRQPNWPLGDWLLHRQAGHARLSPRLAASGAPPPGESWVWSGEPVCFLADYGQLHFTHTVGRGIAADRLSPGAVRVVWRQGGERFRPDCRRPRRTLKNLLREQGVSPLLRARLPLVYAADQLVWVAGVGVDCGWQAGPGQPGWLIDWRPAGSAGR